MDKKDTAKFGNKVLAWKILNVKNFQIDKQYNDPLQFEFVTRPYKSGTQLDSN